MKNYSITLIVDQEETQTRSFGYTETVAIAQAFLSFAQQGARELKVLEIHRVDGECLHCGPRNLLANQGLVCSHD